MNSPDRVTFELTEHSVKIETLGKLLGSGFLVAKGIVVTCSHVVEGHNNPLTVAWKGTTHTAILRKKSASQSSYADVAVLETPILNSSWASFGDDVASADSVRAYGFTNSYPSGTHLSAEYEGTAAEIEGNPDALLLKFKNGLFEPGMSGSALINGRTGLVIGMTKRSRDKNNDLGGYAVALATLRRYVPEVTKALSKQNRDSHLRTQRREDINRLLTRLAKGKNSRIDQMIYVATPLESAADFARYEIMISEAKKQGYTAIHVSEHPEYSSRPLEVINKLIVRANLVIFDLTNEHPNIVYQVGYQASMRVEAEGVLLIQYASLASRFSNHTGFGLHRYSSDTALRALVRGALRALQ